MRSSDAAQDEPFAEAPPTPPPANETMPPTPDPGLVVPAPTTPAGVRFIAWGDVGTGDENQKAVAAAALSVCAAKGCDFVIQLGDNVYDNGVDSPFDPQFEEKFEVPYAGFDVPFYVALGNHDVSHLEDNEAGVEGDGLAEDKGRHQIAYTYRLDRASDKWTMPHNYYAVRAGDVQLFALDTTSANAGREADESKSAQLAWLANGLAKSNATWKLAFAHHALYSNGVHGNAGAGDPTSNELLKRFLLAGVCDKVDVYLSGHDHDLQWLKPREECGRTEFIVSGAGATTRPLGPLLGNPNSAYNEPYFEKGETLGFYWISIVGDTLTGEVYDAEGTLLFARNLTRSA